MIKNISDLEKIKNQYKQTVTERAVGAKTGVKYVLVCGGTGCASSGCKEIMKRFNEKITEKKISDKIKVIQTGCNGICQLGPVAVVYPDGVLYTKLQPSYVDRIVDEHLISATIVDDFVYKDSQTNKSIHSIDDIPFFKDQFKFARKLTGIIDPEKIEEYIGADGYSSLAKALTQNAPDGVIKIIKDSGLRGRGGGGFPTGLKWELAAKEKPKDGMKYVICNADEGDPGAFMDRSQLEGDPHSVIEGMIIAGYSIGASHGYIYCRAEYPLAIDRVEIALEQARKFGLLGKNILGTSFCFDIEVRMGAGAFVCGEETALISSLQGNRGEPKPKPPFPAQEGVWEAPTIVNNVETFGNVPPILKYGADYFNKMGTEKSKGTKIFALAGAVKNVGLIEVPMGISLGKIIFDIGGGIIDDKEFKGAQIGGPSGGCLPRKHLNIPIDYESLKGVGAMMGSGGLVVMSEDTCMVDLAKFFMEFIQDESCGKCPPCRIGTKKMLEILQRISEGKGEESDIEELITLGEDIKNSAICGLGQTAPNPVLSTIANFRDEYLEHIKNKKCPAGVCADLIYAPCQNACPAGVNVPAFVALTSKGRYEEALRVHMDRNPFPIGCGMTCTHPCESKCRRAKLDEPIAIREIKRFMAEKGGREGSLYPLPEIISRKDSEKKKIAIIGGGPSGLTCAYFLRRLGHKVMIYEAQEKLGGMMMYGIPEYRYPKALLENEIRNILNLGVEYKCNTKVGKDVSFDELKNSYDSVVIAVGGWESKKLDIPGEEAEGIVSGKDFLWMVAHNDLKKLSGKVIVIGGGNTAVDVARTALRLGADSVMLAYRRTIDQMPAEKEEISELIEEGIYPTELHDIDEIIVKNGKVKGIKCRKQSLGDFDSTGRKAPKPIIGKEGEIIFECDTLIPAVSQSIDLSFAQNIEKNRNGTIKIDNDTFQTSDPKVFACGDVVTIANLAIAIGNGEAVAVSIEKTLNPGALREFSWRTPKSPDVYFDPDEEPVEKPRVKVEYSAVEERIKNFLLVNRGVNWEAKIKDEAKRCLRCDYRDN